MNGGSSQIRSFRDLRVWTEGMTLAREVYALARALPDSERFGLTAQLQRTAVSIPSNIAEGHGRESTADFIRYLLIASGSLAELQTQILLLRELGYADQAVIEPAMRRTVRLSRMLATLRRRLRHRIKRPPEQAS